MPKPSMFLDFFVCSLIQLNYWILMFTFTKMRFSGFYSISAMIWLFKIAISSHCSALENIGPSSLFLPFFPPSLLPPYFLPFSLLSSFPSPSYLLSSFLPFCFLPTETSVTKRRMKIYQVFGPIHNQ